MKFGSATVFFFMVNSAGSGEKAILVAKAWEPDGCARAARFAASTTDSLIPLHSQGYAELFGDMCIHRVNMQIISHSRTVYSNDVDNDADT